MHLTILFLLITNILLGQVTDQNLRNLSYHVVGVIGNKEQVGGTGFFIKKDSAFYLVSAWHCFSKKNHLTQKLNKDKLDQVKEIVVYRNLADIRANEYSRIALLDPTTQQPTYLTIYHNDTLLDISAIRVRRDSFPFDYYDVRSKQTDLKANIGDKIFYYGFPIKAGKQNDTVEFYDGVVSQLNPERKEITMEIVGYTGCSGSPLFLKKGREVHVWGVLFYALKDNRGRAERCKAVDLNPLIEKL